MHKGGWLGQSQVKLIFIKSAGPILRACVSGQGQQRRKVGGSKRSPQSQEPRELQGGGRKGEGGGGGGVTPGTGWHPPDPALRL